MAADVTERRDCYKDTRNRGDAPEEPSRGPGEGAIGPSRRKSLRRKVRSAYDRRERGRHSHSMVPGGFDVMS